MLYKKWLNVRSKFLIWGFIYAVMTGLFLLNRNGPLFEPRFHSWLTINLWAMFIFGIFAGADIVAGEKANNSLGFLLSRPINRIGELWQLTGDPSTILIAISLLGCLTIGFFQAGLHFFKTKEF